MWRTNYDQEFCSGYDYGVNSVVFSFKNVSYHDYKSTQAYEARHAFVYHHLGNC